MHKIFTKTLFLGKKVLSLPSCHSTNDIASDLIDQDLAQEGTLIITDMQTAGRGQRGNTWEAEPGQNLTFSLIIKPNFLQIREQFYLQMAVSLALADTVQAYLSEPVEIKWPNDMYVGDRKIAGILIENTLSGAHLSYSVVGIGLNVNQIQFSYPQATSLMQLIGHELALEEILEVLLLRLESRYLQLKQGQLPTLRQHYLNKLYWLGERHRFEAEKEFEGIIKGIDEHGRLQVETPEGLRHFDFKQIRFLG